MKMIKYLFILLFPLITQASWIELDYFKVSQSPSGEFSLHCGLSDLGIERIQSEHGWLPKGNLVKFEASERFHSSVMSQGTPVYLINRWNIYGSGLNTISFQRTDGTSFDVHMIEAAQLSVCVVDVDLLEQVLSEF